MKMVMVVFHHLLLFSCNRWQRMKLNKRKLKQLQELNVIDIKMTDKVVGGFCPPTVITCSPETINKLEM